MIKASLIIVLLEDECHRMLVYRYLIYCGVERHKIRIQRSPSGTGSAESWVRKAYVAEVRVYRSRPAKTALIVMIDADRLAVQDRLNQLRQALEENGERAVDGAEKIAHPIPKRNVETWVLCLNGQSVDEETDYKGSKYNWNELITIAAKALSQWTRPNAVLPGKSVASLRAGVNELKRLEP